MLLICFIYNLKSPLYASRTPNAGTNDKKKKEKKAKNKKKENENRDCGQK